MPMALSTGRSPTRSSPACLLFSAIVGLVVLCLAATQLLLISKSSLWSIAHRQQGAINEVGGIVDASIPVHSGTDAVSSPSPPRRRRLGEGSSTSTSRLRLALLRPFTPHDAVDLLESFAEWDKLIPCDADAGSPMPYEADLILSISQKISSHPGVEEIIDRVVDENYSSWNSCFGSVHVVEANISPGLDRYGISSPDQVDHLWVNGPNEHFIRSIKQIQAMEAQYDAVFLMEADAFPWKYYWLDRVVEEVTEKRPFAILGSENHGINWVQTRDSMPVALRHHMTGNSVFNLTDPFFNRVVEELDAERETHYRAIPYDYRISQMYYEASKGIKPDFPFPKMRGVNLPNKTVIFRELWLDVVRAGREHSLIKESTSVDNFGASNFLSHQVSSAAAVVHGKLLRDDWNATAHPMTLVLLESLSSPRSSVHHFLRDLTSVDHPFSGAVILTRRSPASFGFNTLAKSASIPVAAHFLSGGSVNAELCKALPFVSNDWFILASSADLFDSHQLHFPVSRSNKDAVTPVPVVPFVPFDASSEDANSKKLILDNELVFRLDLFRSFCEGTGREDDDDEVYAQDQSIATGFIDFLDSIGVTDTAYEFSDKILYGSFRNFGAIEGSDRSPVVVGNDHVAIQRALQVLAKDRSKSRRSQYPTTATTKMTQASRPGKGKGQSGSISGKGKGSSGSTSGKGTGGSGKGKGVSTDVGQDRRRVLQNQKQRKLMLGIQMEGRIQYKPLHSGAGDRTGQASLAPLRGYDVNDAASSRYPDIPSFHVYSIAKRGGEEYASLLTCILQGLLEHDKLHAFIPDEAMASDAEAFGPAPLGVQAVSYPLLYYDGGLIHSRENIGNTLVSQTYETDVDDLTEAFGDLFQRNIFVAVHSLEDHELAMESRFCVRTNVVCIDHNDFVYDSDGGLVEGIVKVASTLSGKIPLFDRLIDQNDIDAAADRVKLMEDAALVMNEQPQSARDPIFGLVGGQAPEEVSEEEVTDADAEPFHIFQVAKPHTGSTLLNAILQGFFDEDNASYSFLPKRPPSHDDMRFGPYPQGIEETDISGLALPFIVHEGTLKLSRDHLADTIVTKTHEVDIDLLEGTFGRQFHQTFYVVANRAEKDISIQADYCSYPNALCLDYSDFAYSPDSSSPEEVVQIVDRIKEKMLDKFDLPEEVSMDTEKAVDRIKRMEKATEMMASKTFDDVENTFGIHGGHRNRGDKPSMHDGGDAKSEAKAKAEMDTTGIAAPPNLVHLFSPYRVGSCDQRFCPYDQAQSVAIASMQNAARRTTMASVTLAATAFADEADGIIPDDFLYLDPLERSTRSEFPELTSDKKLPFIADIFENLKAHEDFSTFDYVVYTNSDIVLHESFYDVVAVAIGHGHDAFTINRQTVSPSGEDNVLFSAADLDLIFALEGQDHPGSDCFIIKREIFERIELGNLYLGFPPFANFILFQIEALAENYRVFESNELKATYHLGDDQSWREEDEANLELYTHQYHYAIEDLLPLWSSFCAFDWREGTAACTHLVKKMRKFAKSHIDGGIDTVESMYNERSTGSVVNFVENLEGGAKRSGGFTPTHSSPGTKALAFQFLIGVEGTGHHLAREMYVSSPVGEWLALHGIDEDITNLSLSLWDRSYPSSGIWSAPCSNAGEVDGDWWKSEEGGPEGGLLFHTLVERLLVVEKKIEDSLANNASPSSSLEQEQPIVVAINAGIAGNIKGTGERRVSPFMSYPMLGGPCRALQFPNIDLLYSACDIAGVRCQHSVVYRDPYRVLRSTSMNRHFASRHVQLTTLTTMQHVILSQMMAYPDRLTACWEADVEIPNGLGELYGWADPTTFADAYNELFIAPSPITDEDKKEITKDEHLRVYMDAMVASNHRIKELCRQQLEINQSSEASAME